MQKEKKLRGESPLYIVIEVIDYSLFKIFVDKIK